MPELLFETEPAMIQQGQFPDLGPEVSPLLEDGCNTVYEGGSAAPVSSQVRLFQRPEPNIVLGMNSQLIQGRKTLIYGTRKKLFGWDEVNGVHDISKSGGYNLIARAVDGARQEQWSIVSWGEWTIATRGNGNMQIRKPVSPYYDTLFDSLTTGGPPTDVKILARRGPHLLAINNSNGGTNYAFCSFDNVEEWTDAANNTAGNKHIRDADSDIVAAVPFRGEILAFCENSMHIIRYTGDGFVFGDNKLIDGIGAVGQSSVAVAGDRIYGVGPRGIWASDGSGYNYIDTPAVRDFFYDQLTRPQASQIVAWHDRAHQRIVFYYPNRIVNIVDHERNDFGLVYNYKYNNWGVTTIGRSAADRSDVFGLALTGDGYGDIFAQGLETLPPGQLVLPELEMKEEVEVTLGFGDGGFGKAGFGGKVFG